MRVHFMHEHSDRPACGLPRDPLAFYYEATDDPWAITCKRCLRTRAYREWLAATERSEL